MGLPRDLLSPIVLAAVALVVGPGPASADDARGEELFDLCAQCHGTNGEGNQVFDAPAIGGLASWYVEAQLTKFRSGLRGTHPHDYTGMKMRPMSLTLRSEEDIVSVAAHVASLPPASPPQTVEGDAARGKTLYNPCIACHAPDGSGNQALLGAPLKGVSDWYLLAQLEKFKSGVRGANKADQQATMMNAMAQTIPDQQAMKDIVAHINTLRD